MLEQIKEQNMETRNLMVKDGARAPQSSSQAQLIRVSSLRRHQGSTQ
jgi:hypothetical protein